jgi:hypothetical protein
MGVIEVFSNHIFSGSSWSLIIFNIVFTGVLVASARLGDPELSSKLIGQDPLINSFSTNQWYSTVLSHTVLMGDGSKAIFLQNSLFSRSNKPMKKKIFAYSKIDLKKFHSISEGLEFFD